ncbi:hypothetical protein D3C80_1691450 [compost metagenome]
MDCATLSLPVPLSPKSRTDVSVGATSLTWDKTSFKAGLDPTIASSPYLLSVAFTSGFWSFFSVLNLSLAISSMIKRSFSRNGLVKKP